MSSSILISETATSAFRKIGAQISGALASVLVLLLILEALLHFLPVANGVRRADPQAPFASARLVANRNYTWSLGWDLRHVVHGRTNAMGFASPHEYTPDKRALALLGDSYVESVMLHYPESLAGHLDAETHGRFQTFNFGLSGAALPHYLGIAREMGEQFRFDAAIIVVNPSDYVEGFNRQPGLYRWEENSGRNLVSLVPSAKPSILTQIARESALFRYVRYHLKFSPSTLFAARASRTRCMPEQLGDADRKRLSRYVDALPQALRIKPGRIVMVFNTGVDKLPERVERRHAVQTNANCPGIDTLALAELKTLAASRGMQTVDVAPLLEAHYRKHRRPLDFKPVDGHWNGTATAVIAAEIATMLTPTRNALAFPP